MKIKSVNNRAFVMGEHLFESEDEEEFKQTDEKYLSTNLLSFDKSI